jgi:hypothetical protein
VTTYFVISERGQTITGSIKVSIPAKLKKLKNFYPLKNAIKSEPHIIIMLLAIFPSLIICFKCSSIEVCCRNLRKKRTLQVIDD